MGTRPCFSVIFTKGNDFRDFLFASPSRRSPSELGFTLKDGLSYLFYSFRNKYFNKISLGNMLYFQNKL